MNALHLAAHQAQTNGAIWQALPSPSFLCMMRDGVWVIADCNPAAELFLRASQAHLVGTPLDSMLKVAIDLAQAVSRAHANKAPVLINDIETGHGPQTSARCNIQIAPLDDAAGTVMVLLIPRDMAGRLGQTQVVRSAAKSAIGMAEMLAHEIKNPLAGITGAAQLLSMSLAPEDQELTSLIVAECKRIVKLLEQVEQFGDQRPPDRRAINLHDVLERARRSAQVGFAAHLEIVDDYDPSLPDVYADPDQLLQVFLNLIKNAAEAMAQGGTLRMRSFFERGLHVRGHDGNRLSLPVHVDLVDDGPGLPPGIADSIFEPFVSGRENGTGLGLALVSKIMAAHEGWVDVTSRPGHTRFRLSLPLVPPKQEHR